MHGQNHIKYYVHLVGIKRKKLVAKCKELKASNNTQCTELQISINVPRVRKLKPETSGPHQIRMFSIIKDEFLLTSFEVTGPRGFCIRDSGP